MDRVLGALKPSSAIGALYLANAFLAFHVFLGVYINSSYLSTFLADDQIGYLYMTTAVSGLLGLYLISRVLARLGNLMTALAAASIAFSTWVGFAIAPSVGFAVILFILHGVAVSYLIYNLDIFLETFTTREEETGRVRSLYLTVTNSILMISPFIAGLIVDGAGFMVLYFVAAIFMIPFMLILYRAFHTYIDPRYQRLSLVPTLKCLLSSHNVKFVMYAHFVLRLFFSWMVIYMPLYLHEYMLLSWAQIGVIFTIMLSPFVLLEIPLGRLADSKLGEKELMISGFIITGLTTALLSFITLPSVVLWAALLFITRIGASMIEITTESYFFKQVGGDDANTISCFRMLRSLAYVVAPLIATPVILMFGFQAIFVVFGMVLLCGVFFALQIVDSR